MNKILDSLFYASLFALPIDSFPLFPSSNVYRPVSILILVLYFILFTLKCLKQNKTRKHDVAALGIIILLFSHALIGSYFFKEYGHIAKVCITLSLVFVMVVTINDFLLRHKDKIPLDKILNTMKYSFILCVLVGTIQLLARINVVPYSFSGLFTNIFSYRTVNRLQMLSGEPSWMYRHLLLFLCFFVGIKKFKNKPIYILLTVLFMGLSGTTYGYTITFLGFLLYILLFRITILYNKFVIIGMFAIVITFSYMYRNVFDTYTVNKINLVTDVVRNPESINSYLEKDGSAFQRFMNPYIAFKSVEYSYGLGTGLDTYRYVYPHYILTDYPYAIRHSSVEDAVYGKNYITPKSLYAKIFSELGVFPFFLFCSLILYFVYRIKKLKRNDTYRLFFELSIITVIIYGINNDSIIFINTFVLLYIIGRLLKTKRVNAINGDYISQ